MSTGPWKKYRGLEFRERLALLFWARVEKSEGDGCWPWKGNIDTEGYGRLNVDGKFIRAARLAWYLQYGYWPKQTTDHGCRNRACARYDHLEDVPNAVNVLRGESLSAQNARKTHCKRGHPLSGTNLYKCKLGRRVCRTCVRARQARRQRLDAFWRQQAGMPAPLEKL